MLSLISDFTGTDENPLSEGGNWATVNSSGFPVQRLSNAAAGTNASDNFSYWTPANFGPDVEAYLTRTIADTGCGIILRVKDEGGAGTWDGYSFRGSSGGIQIQRVDNSVTTNLLNIAISPTWASGDKLGARVIGSVFQIWRQLSGNSTWDLLGAATDTTYPSAGKIGIRVFGLTERVDDFNAGPMEYFFGGTPPQVPADFPPRHFGPF